jgi:hypothetical protein
LEQEWDSPVSADKDLNQEHEQAAGKKKLSPREWEMAADKLIREAMERGEFDNLPGQGKPQDLWADAHVPPEWQLAFKMLKDADFAPDWIEQDMAIRAELEKLYAPFERHLERASRPGPNRAEREAKLIAEFRQHAAELNRIIDVFNLKAPTPCVHRPRIRIEEEVARFRAACGKMEERAS